MAFNLTNSAKTRAQQTNLKPSLVLEIDGVTTLYGCVIVKKYVRINDAGLVIGDGWTIGGTDDVEDQSDIISLDGTTTDVTQQLLQDKGGTGSISSLQISLIDPFDEATKLVSPGVVVEDILGRGARVWLSFAEGAWPEDYTVLFRGQISSVSADSKITLTVASPEIQKNQELFFKIQTALSADITNSQTSIAVQDASAFVLPSGDGKLRSYVRVGDELVEFTGVNTGTSTLTGCVRGSLGTVAAVHTNGDEVDSFYRLKGNGPTLALQVYMSGKNGPFVTDVPIRSIQRLTPSEAYADALYFETDVITLYGIVVGDKVTVSGATNSTNNFTEAVISSIEPIENGYLVYVSGESIVDELTTSAVAAFRSKYDVLGYGAQLGGDEVDVPEFERLIDLFVSSFPDYDFYLKDTVTVRDFVDTQILFPCGAYSIPRKGKISMGFTSPPVAIATIPQLDSTQIVNPDKTSIQRSIGKYFYNSVIYKYDLSATEDKYKAGRITLQSDSLARIQVGNKPMTIQSDGLRNDPVTNKILDTNSRRFMERYKFGAELIKCKVQYGTGFQIEVGDVVIYGDNTLLLPDTKFATRSFEPRLMEVVNKSMNIKTGEVQLDLLDTNYLTDGRYGIFSPSSVLDSGSTSSVIRVKDSFGIDASEIEADKWRNYIGRKVVIHDEDWTVQWDSVLLSISDGDPYELTVQALPGAPPAGYVMDLREYQDDAKKDESISKSVHCFWTPQIQVVSGTSGTVFDVGSSDAAKLLQNATILLHTDDWVTVSSEVQVQSVSGTTVTLKTSLGFTPNSTYFVELVGFKDGGSAYRFL